MLSTTETAQRLGCSDDTVLLMIKRGDLPAYKVGRRYKIAESDLLAYLEAARIKK